MKVPLTSIERDEGLQMRAKPLSRELVRDYVEARRRGVVLPPVPLFVDEQGRYWPGDGWHRIAAEDSLGLSEIEADVRPGGRRAAFLFALGANDTHGARRTRQDKTNAVRKALADPEVRQMSDREIGRLCGVDHKTVGKMRVADSEGSIFDGVRRGRDGKTRRVSGKLGISPVGENVAFDSARGGAGGGDAFNVVREMRDLEGTLAGEFARWPEEKRHAFCVAMSNFAKLHDPEIRERTRDALDEMLEPGAPESHVRPLVPCAATTEGETRG